MKEKLLVALILLLGFVLRFYSLDNFPNGFQRDEAFLGYNAFSLLKTGREISGDYFPLHLRSFLFTPAGYSYFSILPIMLFGLSVFSIRFVSAFFGLLAIPLIYLIVKEIFEKEKILKKVNNLLIFFPPFLLAISPWHVNLSRNASVITVVVFFILLGTYLYLRSIKLNSIKWLIFSFISFSISLFFYISPYSFLPVFLPGLFIFYKTNFKKIFFVLYIFLIIIPLSITLSSANLSTRVNSISILKHEESLLRIEESIRNDGARNIGPNVIRFFHNKPSVITTIFLQNYFDHMSYSFLFNESHFPDRYRVPRMGILYLFELSLIVLGAIFILKNNLKSGFFLMFWILISPIGSALSFDDIPNMQRILYMLPPILILEGIGFYFLIKKFGSKIILSFFSVIIFLNLFYYLHQYYIHGTTYRPWYRQEGYKNLVEKIDMFPTYKKVIVTNRESGAFVEVAFFNKYDPYVFQNETKNQNINKSGNFTFGKYVFVDDECPLREEIINGKPVVNGRKENIYVNSGLCKISKSIRILDTIKRSDNSTAFYIVSL